METEVRFLIQIIDSNLSFEDKAVEATALFQDLQNLSCMDDVGLDYYSQTVQDKTIEDGVWVVQEKTLRTGVRFKLPADRVGVVLDELRDRMQTLEPMELRILLNIGNTTLQVQTDQPEELAAIIKPAEFLLPPISTFRALAESYARLDGEFSPVEEANLELLRDRLGLTAAEAAQILRQALGVYRARQERIQQYEDVLNKEITREFPLDESTWALLKELADTLRLDRQTVSQINSKHIEAAQAQLEETQLQQECEVEQTRLEEETQLQIPTEQQQQVSRQQLLRQYRDEFAQAISTTLYPLEFDQGRLEQARRIWELSPEEARAIEMAVTAELYGGIDSAMNIDYTHLRHLLWQGNWRDADEETERVLLSALDEEMRPLQIEAISQIAETDLQTIDQLWARYSNGNFGFAAQLRIYVNVVGEQPIDFAKEVGWMSGIGLGGMTLLKVAKPYHELQFYKDAPTGHLPTWRWGCSSLESGYDVDEELMRTFFSRLKICMTLVDAVSPSGITLAG